MSTPGAISQKNFIWQKTIRLLGCFMKLNNALLIKKEQGMRKVVISN